MFFDSICSTCLDCVSGAVCLGRRTQADPAEAGSEGEGVQGVADVLENMEQTPGSMVPLFGPAHRPSFDRDLLIGAIADTITLRIACSATDHEEMDMLRYKVQRSSASPIRRLFADFNNESIHTMKLEFRGVCDILPAMALMPRRGIKLGCFSIGDDTFTVAMSPRACMSAWTGDMWPAWLVTTVRETQDATMIVEEVSETISLEGIQGASVIDSLKQGITITKRRLVPNPVAIAAAETKGKNNPDMRLLTRAALAEEVAARKQPVSAQKPVRVLGEIENLDKESQKVIEFLTKRALL